MSRLGVVDGVGIADVSAGDLRRRVNFAVNPTGGGFLEMLGSCEEERVVSLACLLRTATEADKQALLTALQLALAEESATRAVGLPASPWPS